MNKTNFLNQMKDISSLGNKSVTVSKQDFDALVNLAESELASGTFFVQNHKIHVSNGLITKIEFTGGIGGV